MSVKNLTANNFENEILNSTGISLVDFYADWCGPCKMVAPVVEQIAEERSDITVAKVNVNESPDLATKYGVKNIPTLMVFKNGILTSKAVGYHSKSDLLAIVE